MSLSCMCEKCTFFAASFWVYDFQTFSILSLASGLLSELET